MRKALRGNPAKKRVSKIVSVPVPVDGLDAVSELAHMPPENASVLTNFFPERGYIRPRRGYKVHGGVVSGASPVESLMTWVGPTSSKLFAASGTKLYDFTSGSPGTHEITSLSNARFQHVNFATTGGNFLFIVNGVNGPYHYNGTTWATPTITGTVDASSFVHVAIHQARLWFVVLNSTKGAYLPVDSISGAATTFEFGRDFSKGGYLQAIGTWTVDTGVGPDDYLVAVSSRGQSAIYRGTDPSSSSAWTRVGVFDHGPPIGRRCLARFGSELAIITLEGVVPISQAIKYERSAAPQVSVMKGIQPLINADAKDSADLFGWQILSYPKGNMLLLNVPLTEGVSAKQYVMNTITHAPAQYTNQPAMCWDSNYQDRLFFGGANGIVYEADIGSRDVKGAVVSEVRCAFSQYGTSNLKQFTMVRPMILSDGEITPSVSMDVDFSDDSPAAPPSTVVTAGAKWNQVDWNEFNWAGGQTRQRNWTGVSGVGSHGAVRMKTAPLPEEDISLWDEFVWDEDEWDADGGSAIDVQINQIEVSFLPGDGI